MFSLDYVGEFCLVPISSIQDQVMVEPYFLPWLSIQDQKALSMICHPQRWFGLVSILLLKNQLAIWCIPYKVHFLHVSNIFWGDAQQSRHPPPLPRPVHKPECGNTYWAHSYAVVCSLIRLLRHLFLKQVQVRFLGGLDSSRKLRIYVPLKAHLQPLCATWTQCWTMLSLIIQHWGGISTFRLG